MPGTGLQHRASFMAVCGYKQGLVCPPWWLTSVFSWPGARNAKSAHAKESNCRGDPLGALEDLQRR
jgi:hypothetical protein